MRGQPPINEREPPMRQETRRLRGLLQSLGSDATHNQPVMQRFQERELALLCASDLVRLLECLTIGMRSSFSLDSVKLKLLDPCFVIRDLLIAHSDADTCLMRDIELCTDVGETRARFEDLHAPWLGSWDEHRHLPLFGRHCVSPTGWPVFCAWAAVKRSVFRLGRQPISLPTWPAWPRSASRMR